MHRQATFAVSPDLLTLLCPNQDGQSVAISTILPLPYNQIPNWLSAHSLLLEYDLPNALALQTPSWIDQTVEFLRLSSISHSYLDAPDQEVQASYIDQFGAGIRHVPRKLSPQIESRPLNIDATTTAPTG